MYILTHRWRNVTIYSVLRIKSTSKRYKCWSWKEAIFGHIYKNSKNESTTTKKFFLTGFWFSSRTNLLWNRTNANANHEATKYVSKHSTTMWPRCSISTSMAIFSRPNSGCLSSNAGQYSIRVNITIWHQCAILQLLLWLYYFYLDKNIFWFFREGTGFPMTSGPPGMDFTREV